jgi:hypothetical protein
MFTPTEDERQGMNEHAASGSATADTYGPDTGFPDSAESATESTAPESSPGSLESESRPGGSGCIGCDEESARRAFIAGSAERDSGTPGTNREWYSGSDTASTAYEFGRRLREWWDAYRWRG